MRIEIAQHGRMSESGSSLLRLIQNQDMPLLDLLIREAVQNSLDASNGQSFVGVDVSVKVFSAKALNRHLEGVTRQLNNRFTSKTYKSIVVSDINTVGLTGPIRYEDVRGNDFGNCLKLIYEISKPQTEEGAGGSWGLGKTIYFRVGIGLVLYYSRICENGKYRSRLAACFVEDETKPGSIIPSSGGVKRGIAWWGAKTNNQKTTVPIENEREIAEVLSVFGIRQYKGKETGTTIIIPYVDEVKLLQEAYAINEDVEQKPYWVNSIEEYVKVAFQRWYAPRILNTAYNGAYLRPSVNNSLITVSSLLPLFRVIRELYISSVTGSLPDDSLIEEEKVKYQIDEIRIREVFVRGTSSAGKFAFLKMSDVQLKMTPPENQKSPYQQITNRVVPMDNGNTPIVMFTRKPGMIVGYDFNGAWTHRMPKSGEQEYIIGLFVANSSNQLVDIYSTSDNHLSLEEYLRQGEKADHASWSDRTIGGRNPRIVSKVQTGVIKTIASNYKEKPAEAIERNNTGLSHALANILLPKNDFGHTASGGGSGGGGGGNGVSNKPSIAIGKVPSFMENRIVFEFEANVIKGKNFLQLCIITDFKKYYSDVWESEEEIGKAFPVAFTCFYVEQRRESTRRGAWEPFEAALTDMDCGNDVLFLSFSESESYKTKSGIIITSNKKQRIKGHFEVVTSDPDIKVSVDVKEV